MPRSFQIVEDKIAETEFFLDKLQFNGADFSHYNFYAEAHFYLSAFLSAVRSITFCLQASLNDLEGFEHWYQEKQNKLRNDNLAKFFLEARNLSQKVGYYPLVGGRMHSDENDVISVILYFDKQNEEGLKNIPDTDVYTACKTQFVQILEIIKDCYISFGKIIDPEKYYTFENLTENGLRIEDFEIELGFEEGWTNEEGLTIEDRVMLLSQYIPECEIDWIFVKYLGTDRYGLKSKD